MKKIFFVIGMLFLFACEKDENQAVISSDVVAPEITSHDDGFTKVITEGTLGENVVFNWSAADYGVATQVTYTLQVDSLGRNFSAPTVLGETGNDELTISLASLNDKLINGLKVTPNEAAALELRVVSAISGKVQETSSVIHIVVTPWKQNIPDMLWVPGEYQGWSPGTAPTITEVTEGKYEGYVNITAATGYKFTSAPDWEHINYGDAGTPGHLTTDGLANGMGLGTPGYYRFNVDTDALTFTATLTTSWGLIGDATTGGWDNSTPMTYNADTKKWSVTANLVNGALKFRANNNWDNNYGPADSNAFNGTLIQTDGAISIPEAGNYTVTIDLSKSGAPYAYTYSVVKN